MRGRRWSLVRRALSLVAALGIWQALTSYDVTLWLRFEQFPTVTDVARAFGDRLGGDAYWQDLTDSLTRIVTGFALAAVLGITAGTAIARSRLVSDLLGPVLEVVRPVPAIALVPVAILLFPSNEQGIVFITCTAAFFPVMVSTRHAVRALTPVWEEAVLTMGGGRWRILGSVVLPGALPGILGGLSVGIGVSWICVISAEMISGEYGVGYRTWQDYTVVDYPGVFVGMVTIGLLGWITSTAVELLGRRLTRWLPRTEGSRPPPPYGTGRGRNPRWRHRYPWRRSGCTHDHDHSPGVRLTLRGAVLGRAGAPVLDGVDLDVVPGEILAVVGPSGCGKSTLLRTLAGLLPALGGEVAQDGEAITAPRAERALVFQDDALLPWRTVRANVELPLAIRGVPRGARRARAESWLARVGLDGHGTKLPHRISGGQRQRVQLARALAAEPRAVLMDEPFGALDAQTRAGMQQLLVDVLRGTGATVVFVTHDVDEALFLGDRVALLPTGRVLDVPRPRERAAHTDPATVALRREVLESLTSAHGKA